MALEISAPESAGFSSARLGRIDGAMQSFVDAGKVAGAVTVVSRHGKVVHNAAFGLADVDSKRPMRLESIFRIYSMSKPIVAAAVMMVVEEGLVRIDDPIARFIPEFGGTRVFVKETAAGLETADLERPITVRHLLMHTSGIPYPFGGDSPVGRLHAQANTMRFDETLAEKMPRLAALPLVHQPGKGWTYGMSIDVLGRLLEVVSGQMLDVFLRERLFGPLGMNDAGFHVPAESVGRLTTQYWAKPDGGFGQIEPLAGWIDVDGPRRFLMGGGGLAATADDYAAFCQMMLNGGVLRGNRVLGRKAIETMTASQMTRDEIPFVPPGWGFRGGCGMAFGVRTVVDAALAGCMESAGTWTWQGAAATDFWVDPKEDLYGISMIQLMGEGNERYRLAESLRILTYQALVD
jgi:CubicO group peptidase (beta-lactamase class C family)